MFQGSVQLLLPCTILLSKVSAGCSQKRVGLQVVLYMLGAMMGALALAVLVHFPVEIGKSVVTVVNAVGSASMVVVLALAGLLAAQTVSGRRKLALAWVSM